MVYGRFMENLILNCWQTYLEIIEIYGIFEKRDEYRRRCSSDENNVDDDNEGGIGVGGAPVAP